MSQKIGQNTPVTVNTGDFKAVLGLERKQAIRAIALAGQEVTSRTMIGVMHDDGLNQSLVVPHPSGATVEVLLDNKIRALKKPGVQISATYLFDNSAGDYRIEVTAPRGVAVKNNDGTVYLATPGIFGPKITKASSLAFDLFFAAAKTPATARPLALPKLQNN